MSLFMMAEHYSARVEELYREKWPLYYNYALKHTQNPEDAKDVVEAAFLELSKKFDWHDAKVCHMDMKDLSVYTMGIVKKCVLVFYHKRDKEDLAGEVTLPDRYGAHSAEDCFLHKYSWEQVHRAAPNLPRRDQIYLQLKYVYGVSNAEISKALGIKESSICVIRQRILLRLRDLIEKGE